MNLRTIGVLALLFFYGITGAKSLNNSISYGVDQRYELTSIVWKLAGANEYYRCEIPKYNEAVDAYFKPYETDALIEFCKQLRALHPNMAHAALSGSSSCLDIVGKDIKVREGFDPKKISHISSAWSEESFLRYVDLLNAFYKRSKFNKFFKQQQGIYKEAEDSFERVYGSNLNLSAAWFTSMFGDSLAPIHINLCIGIGPNNYANLYSPEHVISILYGCCATKQGIDANYTINSLPIILHEVLHSYVNPIAERHVNEFNTLLGVAYPFIEDDLHRSNYNWSSVPYEWLTDLSLLLYMSQNGYPSQQIEKTIASDSARGFIWQRVAFESLETFHNNRDEYPLFKDFVPVLISMLEGVSENLDRYTIISYDAPTLLSVSKDTNMVYYYADIDTFVIELEFSEKLQYTVALGLLADDVLSANQVLGQACRTNGINWMYNDLTRWKSRKIMQIRLTKDMLMESKCTGVLLTTGYKSIAGVALERDIKLHFKFE